VTGAPNFPGGKVHAGYRNALWSRETLEGIEVVRVWTYIAPNAGVVRRTLDYLSFMVSAFVAGLFLPRPRIIVATSPQFFTTCAAYVLSRLKRRPFVFELRDLWPDSIVAVGAMRESLSIKALRRLEYFLYEHAARIVSVTYSFKAVLSGNGVPPEKIAVVPNGADVDGFMPGEKPADLVERHGLEGKFVAAYIGTLGMAHGLGMILDAAEQSRGNPKLAFVIVGDGSEREALEEAVRSRALANVTFVGPVNKDEVKRYWRLADAALVLLRDRPVFRHVLPSKMFEAMATACPIVLGVLGESAQLLERSGAGIVVPPEDARAMLAALERLAANEAEAREMGHRGRRFVEAELNRDGLAAAMLSELHLAAQGVST
jgi:hypothetical protein